MAVECVVGSFTRPASAGTDTVVTGLGFAPTALIFLQSSVLTADGWRAGVGGGLSAGSEGAFGGRGFVVYANDAHASPRWSEAIQLGKVTQLEYGGTTASVSYAGTPTFDGDGFTIDWDASPYDGEQEHIAYLALGGGVKVAVANIAVPTGASSGQRIIAPLALGFLPAAALAFAHSPAWRSVSFGVHDSYGQEWSLTQSGRETTDPSDVMRRLSTGACVTLHKADDGTIESQLAIRELSPHRIDLEVVAGANLSAYDVRLVVLGGDGFACEAGTFARSTGAAPAAQTVPVKGTPKGALFATVSHTADDSTQPHARASLGVSDGTNNRAVAWQVEDNAGTSNSDTHFSSDKALLVADNAAALTEGASAATFDVGEINLSWNPNDATALTDDALRGLGRAVVLTAYHEAGHCAAGLSLGWAHNLAALFVGTDDGQTFWRETAAGRQPVTDLGQLPTPLGTSLTGAPPCPGEDDERMAWARVGGAVAMAGGLCENAVRRAWGWPELPQPAWQYSTGDAGNVFRYRDASPEAAGDYFMGCLREARRVVAEHGAQIENLAHVLLKRWRLTVPECVTVWQRGALPRSGHVGRFRLCASRDGLASWGCPIPTALPFLAPA